MSRVIAALDRSDAARPVLSAAVAVAALLHADVDALHVGKPGPETARVTGESGGVPVRLVSGPTVRAIVTESQQPDVVAIVLGSRGRTKASGRAGHVATQVATSVLKPVVVVPPDTRCPVRLWRLVVPLEATIATADAIDSMVRAACDGGADVILLHVLEEHAVPPFTDQPQHEVDAWIAEFIRRYCDHANVRVELRSGVPAERVGESADELGADALLLGWNQRLDAGRGRVVRSVLERSRIPVILVPITHRDAGIVRCPGPRTGR